MTAQQRALEIIEAQLEVLDEEPAALTADDYARLVSVCGGMQVLRSLLAMQFSTEPESAQHPAVARMFDM